MKTLLMAFASFLLMIAQAQAAAPSCLKTVSDQDLLNEVALRMNSTSTPHDSAIPTFSCHFKTLTISLVNAATGAEQREDLSLTDPTSCSSVENTLSSKIGNRALSRAVVVAGCNFKTLMRVSLDPGGMLKRLQDQSLSDPTSCNAARDRINESL